MKILGLGENFMLGQKFLFQVKILVYKPNGTSHQILKCRTKVVLNKKASPSWILAKNHASHVLYTIRHSCQHNTERRTNSATLIKTERRTKGIGLS